MISPGRSPPDRGGGERRVRVGAQPYLGARTQPGPATRWSMGCPPECAAARSF